MREQSVLITAHQCPDIIMDIDDVISDTNTIMIQALNKFTGHQFSLSDWTDHDLTTIYPNLQYDEVSEVIIKDKVFEQAIPLPGIRDAVNALIDAGYNIHFCTARNHLAHGKEVTEWWLDFHDIPRNNAVIYCNYGESKSKSYERVSSCFAYMFDDAAFNIQDAVQHGAVIKPMLVSKPWNAKYNGYLRTNGVWDFCKSHGLL